MPAVRIALAAAAVLACAWFAVAVRDGRDEANALALLQVPSPTPARTARILGLLDKAGWLNPDTSVDTERAQALVRAGRPRAGEAVLLRVVRDEPQNVAAWVALQVTADRAHDLDTVRLAGARIRQLVPAVPAAP